LILKKHPPGSAFAKNGDKLRYKLGMVEPPSGLRRLKQACPCAFKEKKKNILAKSA